MKFKDIPQFTRSAGYHCNVSWQYLEHHLTDQALSGLDLDPDFQRGHVWSVARQRSYVEFVLKGGQSGRDLLFNCVGWNSPETGEYVLVDGKQRVQAVTSFLSNELAVFSGNFLEDFTDRLVARRPSFVIHINDLPTKAQVLTWYLEVNTGGVPHTEDELDKVRKLLEKENSG